MAVAKAIIDNIRESKLTKFLKEKNVVRDEIDKGMEMHHWVSKILLEEKTTVEDINDCLYKELMFGHRRLLRFYELKNVRKIKKEVDWKDFLEAYDCPSMNFNRVIETNLTDKDKVKVAAMNDDVVNGNIQKVNILFVYNLEIFNHQTNSILYSYSYLPVTFDLVKKTICIKVWNKDDTSADERPDDQIKKIYNILEYKLDFQTKTITINPQNVIYKMSKALFDDFFRQLPNTDNVDAKREQIEDIVNSLLTGVELQNSEVIDNKINMNKEVIDVNEEIYKLLQQVALYDYLKDNKIESLLKNTDKYISRIRFNDRDNLTASLTSETGVKCIFDAKTFMCIRNSLDLVENIVALVVSFKKDVGLLSVKYDASNIQYLNIHILNNRYYEEDDFIKLWELYKEYESENNANDGAVCFEDNAQAM